MMNNFTDEIQIDDRKVKNILRKIIIEEARNIKTQDKSDAKMVEVIKKLIEEELKCY